MEEVDDGRAGTLITIRDSSMTAGTKNPHNSKVCRGLPDIRLIQLAFKKKILMILEDTRQVSIA